MYNLVLLELEVRKLNLKIILLIGNKKMIDYKNILNLFEIGFLMCGDLVKCEFVMLENWYSKNLY